MTAQNETQAKLESSINDLSLNESGDLNDSAVAKGEQSSKREAFGNRHLTNDQDVFQFNAW